LSSTGRGTKRRIDDAYFTPAWAVDIILPHLPISGHVLEPSAGEGAILRSLHLFPSTTSAESVTAVEIDPGRAETLRAQGLASIIEADFLAMPRVASPFDLIIGNPPFSLAQKFVEASLAVLAPGGTCAMLLRLAFLESSKRRRFHMAHPCEVNVLPRRPSFTGVGTDSAAYAWFVWGPERANRWRVL